MRTASIDAFRVIAIFGVIFVHTDPFTSRVFGGGATHVIEILLTRGGRVALPFFFMVAGFFFARNLQRGEEPLRLFTRYARRLGLIFVGWSLFYLFVPGDLLKLWQQGYPALLLDKLQWCLQHPWLLVFQGVAPHLWFLVALIIALGILGLCLHWKRRRLLAAVAIGLYVAGLLAGPYAYTQVGLETRIDPRNGPFFSTLYVYLGWLLAETRWRPRDATVLCLLILGGAGFVLEMSAIGWIFGQGPKIQDFGLFMIPFGLGFVLLAFKHPDFGRETLWPAIGRHVLGIYAVHLLFVEWLAPLHAALHSYAWEVAFPVVVFALALAATLAIARQPFLKRFVL